MFQLDGLNQLFSNAPVTDRNVVADIDFNRNYDSFKNTISTFVSTWVVFGVRQSIFHCGSATIPATAGAWLLAQFQQL
ncbi:MAG: hypothetical protein WBV73_22320 [Phormidium sp.]